MDIEIGTVRIENGRSTGQRFVHSNVVEKVIALMTELGEKEVVLAARRWRDGPGKVPGRTALEQARNKAEAHREAFLTKGMPREAAYCELAAFCCQACLDEASQGGNP